ncbi:MAG: OmpA family protein [Flammeovirgaceae bacterium]|nr:OmpA family protein [Flammeovirgaceae bacterium]
MMFRSFLFFFLLTAFFSYGQAQLSTKSKKAIEYYNQADNFRVRSQYNQAISLLNKAIEKDKNFAEAYFRLGLTYKMMGLMDQSNANFQEGLRLTKDAKKQRAYYFELGDNYMRMGDYQSALTALDKYLSMETTNKVNQAKAVKWKENAQFGLENKKSNSKFRPYILPPTVNRFMMQYFPVLTADEQQLIFTRRVGPGPDDDEDLVVVRKTKNGEWGEPESISSNINSRYNEGTCTISADGRQLIFTSCLGRKGLGNCDLFESKKIGDEWTEPENLGPKINSGAWESQPSLSSDGRILYFVSDRRGGLGERDIYVSYKEENGSWTTAENLGEDVNTINDEISPFIHVNNRTLFFASNGRVGFGGYDIYRSEKEGDQWTAPVNIGSPINNHEDQFSLFINASGERGYYSHEVGRDNNTARIYEFDVPEELQIRFKSNFVKGVVRDKETNQPLKASVELFDLQNDRRVSLVESDSLNGNYLMVLTQGSDYALYVNAHEYLFTSLNFNYELATHFEPIEIDIFLEKAKTGASAVLQNIFFDVDKYELKEKSKTELTKIIRFLNENPDVQVELSGHTDNTGSASYNKNLSLKRAESVANYLVLNGIESKRIVKKGYGADKPIRPNDTEENKQFNRRIEFKIL